MEDTPPALGNCTFVLGEVADGFEICNDAGHDEVLVRNRFGLFSVVLCKHHKAKHFAFYEKLRSRSRVRGRASQSRGRRSDNLADGSDARVSFL